MANNTKPKLIVDPATEKAYQEEQAANRNRRIQNFLKDIKDVCDNHEIDIVPMLQNTPTALVAAIGVSIRDENVQNGQPV